MKKNEIKDYMIVETGFDNKKYLVIKGKLVDDSLKGFSLEDDFDDSLINNENKPYSISKVYEPVKLTLPFEMNIKKIFRNQNPKVIWERQPTPLSKKILSKMKKSEVQDYIMGLAYSCVIVEWFWGIGYSAHLSVKDDMGTDELEKILSIKNEREEWVTNNTDKKNFIVYNQRMAGYLMQRGFVLIDMQPDLKKTDRNVFFFNNTPQLKSAIDEYMSR